MTFMILCRDLGITLKSSLVEFGPLGPVLVRADACTIA